MSQADIDAAKERYLKNDPCEGWLDAITLADAYCQLVDDPRLKCPLDGPGSHRADLQELRPLQSQQQQPVNQRLLDTAKVLCNQILWHGHCGRLSSIEDSDERAMVEALDAAIAAAEAEIAERSLPVTEEWCISKGWLESKKRRLGFIALSGLLVVFPPLGNSPSGVEFCGSMFQPVKNRGDVLDLLRILKVQP